MNKIIIVAVLVTALPAYAQDINFGALEDDANVASISTGAEHGLVLGAGYGRVVSVAERRFVLGGDFALQWAEVDVSDVRLKLGVQAPLVERGRFKLIGAAATLVRGTRNDTARMVSVGPDVAVLGGFYARHWFAAAELGVDWALATHITHDDAYRMQVYADARDGWYGSSATTLRTGVQTGASFGGNDIVLRLGRLQDLAGNPALVPFYATLGYDRRW